MYDISGLNRICSQVRRDILRMVHNVQSGHPGGSLGCVEFLVVLYFVIMKHDPKNFNMNGREEDIFFLSNGHVSPLWYSVLARIGYFNISELNTFRKLNGRLQGHPAIEEGLPGIRIASGSLGQGLSVGLGAALSKRLNNDNHFVYTLHGDGELQEGQIWEAALFAAKYKLDNLIATVDWNGKQIDGNVEDVMPLGDLQSKWESFGWKVLSVNGNDIGALIDVLNLAKSYRGMGKPIVILMKTQMGMGVDFMMGTHKWHGKAHNDEQLVVALDQLEETLGDY